MPRARFLQEPSLWGSKSHIPGGDGEHEGCAQRDGTHQSHVPMGWGTPGLCLYGMGHTRAVSPWDGALSMPCPHGLTLPLPPGERAGCAGQVRGQRGRLGGRRAVPLRGQPRVLSLRWAPLAPPPFAPEPPATAHTPLPPQPPRGSRQEGRGRRPHADEGDAWLSRSWPGGELRPGQAKPRVWGAPGRVGGQEGRPGGAPAPP